MLDMLVATMVTGIGQRAGAEGKAEEEGSKITEFHDISSCKSGFGKGKAMTVL
jgi:hypothetical protein